MFPIKDSQGNSKLITRSKGIVIDNRDPLKRGRIRVNHPQLGETTWIPYLTEPSQFSVPSIGSIVYIECDVGTHTHPIASGNLIMGPDNAPAIPNTFRRPIPTNRGIYSPGGHLIELDDGIAKVWQKPDDTDYTTENKGVRITSSGNNKIHIVEDSALGNTYILIQDASGNYIKFDYKKNVLTIESKQDMVQVVGTKRTTSINGKDIEQVGSDRETTIGGKLTINVTGEASIFSNDKVTVEGNTKVQLKSISAVELGLVTDAVIKGDAFKAYFDGHYHTGNLGAPTTAPVVPMPTSTLSNKVRTE